MTSVLIYGGGSIGNHLAFACRQENWRVDMYDVDHEALIRTKEKIYPERYGQWDDAIRLREEIERSQAYDFVIVGTPPESHLPIALDVLSNSAPKVLLIEKPLCTPDLNGIAELKEKIAKTHCYGLIAYNHNFTNNTLKAIEIIKSGLIGNPQSMHVRWLEHWGGIFRAHPWLDGPSDSYLGFSRRGGGACSEHSHAISLFQLFASELDLGRVISVSAVMDRVQKNGVDYDRTTQLSLRTSAGLIGTVIQDVVTDPAQKTMRIQGDAGFLEWYANYDPGNDAIVYGKMGESPTTELFPKARPDDFQNQIRHVRKILDGSSFEPRNTLDFGIETMRIVSAAYESNEKLTAISV